MINEQRVLLVDDEAAFLATAKLILKSSSISNVDTLNDSRKLLAHIEKQPPSIIVLDLTMPYIDGKECLKNVQENHPEIPVIILTGIIDIESAVWCMKNGACDYVTKPISDDDFIQTIQKNLDLQRLQHETTLLRESLLTRELKNPDAFTSIITNSSKMHNIFAYAEAISRTRMPVLVIGETGTGKELMVQALHNLRSPESPYISVNVSGLDDQMFSDTLFGHVKGAYTGAISSREGVIEKARGGTLFLDEIGDLKPESQVKLLRLIQENEYFPVGSDSSKKADVWIITATNIAIENSPSFRKDLYYRLKTHRIDLPSLDDRKSDIPLLIAHFARIAADRIGLPASWKLPSSLVKALSELTYEGNIRELQGIIFDVVGCTNSDGSIPESLLAKYVPEESLAPLTNLAVQPSLQPQQWSTLPTLKQMEQLLIQEALERTNHNKSAAAALLGVTRQTIAKLKGE